jgi:flavin-dependent thymidylate synthase
MKVNLISHTPNAEDLLIFTKNTRLEMNPSMMEEIKSWPADKKAAELDYMAKTIKSSWEFIDVVFTIQGITRATAQQMTRTRNASYAMQSQRVTDARNIEVTNKVPGEAGLKFHYATETAKACYSSMVDLGVPLEDARGILPMNTQCNLVAKYNLRSLTDLVKARKSMRAQGEYTDVVNQMESLVVDVWPWSKPFFVSDKQVAIEMLEAVARRIGIQVGKGDGWEIAKAVDLLRK